MYVNGNGKLVSAIMENGENGISSPKTHPRTKFHNTDPPKVWVSGFLSVDRNGKLMWAILKMAIALQKWIHFYGAMA